MDRPQLRGLFSIFALLPALWLIGCAGPNAARSSDQAASPKARDASSPNVAAVRGLPAAADAERPANLPENINAPFTDENIDVDAFVTRFEGESREVAVHRKDILAALDLKPGHMVADIGAGTGLFTVPISRAVGTTGLVYAVDIQPKFLEWISRRMERKGLTVYPVECTAKSTELVPRSVDRALICDTYHHFEYPSATLASLFEAMRPGSLLVVVDFERIPGVSREWILKHVRDGKEVFRREIEAAGFEFVDQVAIDGMKENYVLRFRRPN